MKVLLTGASGFVGSHILDRLRARGIATAVLLRPSSDKRFMGAHMHQLDVRTGSVGDPQCLRAAMQDATHVIHCAGCTRALRTSEFHEVNRRGTRHLVEAINQQQGQIQRLVHISSLAAGGPAPADRPALENDPPHPVSEYGRSKLAGEQEVREACKSDHVILRPPAVYGPRDTAFLPLFKAVRAHIRPCFNSGRQPLSFVYVRDLAEAAVTCLTHAAAVGKIFHVASPEIVTARALADEVATQMGRWVLPLSLPATALWPLCCCRELVSRVTRRPHMLSRQKYSELCAPGWVCSPGRLQRELDFTCATTLKNGIAETLSWYRRQGWL